MTQAENPKPTVRGRFTTAVITRREDIAHDLWKIWLKPEDHFNFKPGQYCTIGAGGIERPYSIVSSPDEPEIELFVELVPLPDGNLTPILHKMGVGETVTLRPRPKGIFVLQPKFRNHVLVGTVTGTVPYVSMLRKYLADPEWPEDQGVPRSEHRFFVLEGASFKHELGYDDELAKLAAEHDNIEFLPSISRPDDPVNEGWTGATGRINTLVEDYVAERKLVPAETCIYACGHPQMIEDVRERFEGTDFHFSEERFWKDDE
jgi:ferredoxin--NADP+ reductase